VYDKIIWDEPQSPQDITLLPAAFSPQEYEQLIATGWWHLEGYLWRIMYDFEWNDWEGRRRVMHLRYQLKNFLFSKSQRKLFRKNADLQYVIQPLEYITDEKHILFVKHSERFKRRVPHSILEMTPRWVAPPNMSWECLIYKKNQLIACSFFDMTPNITASIYGMFDPEESHRSLGVLTMCLELQNALLHGQKIYYPGYAYFQPSHMDYKKQFHNTEYINWDTMQWTPVGRDLAIRNGFQHGESVELNKEDSAGLLF
jgi:leucyl-tRNA---protein transferase